MNKLAILSAVALIGCGSLASTDAEARSRRGTAGAVAAGVVGGLAAGALIGAATNAYAAPTYSYGPSYYPDYGYGTTYGYAPAPTYRTTRVVRSYDYAPDVYEESPRPEPTGRPEWSAAMVPMLPRRTPGAARA